MEDEAASSSESEEKLLSSYLDRHPEFLEKWLKEKALNGDDVVVRNLFCAFQNQKNSTTPSSTSILNKKEPPDPALGEQVNNNGENVSGSNNEGESAAQQQSNNARKSSTASTVGSIVGGGSGGGGGHHHIRSKRNSISSERFHTWLSSASNTSMSGSSSGGGGANVKNNESSSSAAAAAEDKANANDDGDGGNSNSNSSSRNDNGGNNNLNRRESKQLIAAAAAATAAATCSQQQNNNNKLLPAAASQAGHNEIFIELVKDISNELNIDCLCHKILVNVSYLTQADRCSLFLARGPQEQRYLVAKLFDVTTDSGPEEALERARAEEIRIPFGVGIVGNVAETKEIVNIKDAYEDPRFNYEVDCRTGYTTHSILALPICNNEDDVIGVAQVINKKTGDSSFSPEDVEIFQRYLTFCGIGIQNAQLFETSVAEYRKNQLLLNLARSIFEEQTGLERLVSKIMKEAQELLQCERSLVYLRDVPLYEASQIESILLPLTATTGETARTRGTDRKMLTRRESKTVTVREVLREKGFPFDFIFELNTEDSEVKKVGASQLEKSPLTRIAQYVARNSEILNIGDAVTWYNQGGSEGGGGGEMVTSYLSSLPRSILCMPIYNGQRQVIGVAQLINKANNQPFTDSDAMSFEAFAIFCGLGIHNTQLYESACKLMAKQSVALECLSYHATASFDDTERLRRDDIPSSAHFRLYSYAFSDFGLTDSETCQATVRMFCELDLVEKFHIPYAVLCRWILSVKKNYRPVKYHNWRHAFNVAQTMFTVLKTGKMEQFLDDLDILGLMVACLCHDLDHRGTNNAFQQLTASPLAVLYSTSTMEHHHFDQCVMILSSEGNNIFQDVTAECYRKVMKIVEKSILSTDLAMYFRKKDKFIELIDNGEISWQGEDKKDLLCGMMMTACDVAAISKPWVLQHKIAKLVADEFFDQGDLEKEQLNQQPVAMMDRDKKDELPKMQLSFIDVICLPLYKTLSEVFPWLQPLLDGCKANRKNWQDLAEKVDMGLTWIDHDFIEKPVEEFTETDTVLEDVNFVVTTLNCGTTFEGVVDHRGSKGHKFKVGRWFRGGKKNSSADSTTTTTTSSLQSPTRFDGIVSEQTNLVIMEEVGGGGGGGHGGVVGGGGDKFSPKKSCLIS